MLAVTYGKYACYFGLFFTLISISFFREMADADTDEKEHAFLAPNVRSDEKMIEALGPAGENFLQPSENQIHTEAEEVYPDTTQGQHHHQVH